MADRDSLESAGTLNMSPDSYKVMQTALFTKVLSDRNLEQACNVAAEIGYDGVELMCREPHFGVETTNEEANNLREHLSDLNLEVPCLATYTGNYIGKSDSECEEELDKLERFCELAEILEVDLIRHNPGGPAAFEADTSHYLEGAKWMRKAANLAATFEKEIGVEIHSSTIIESAEDAVSFVDQVDRDNVGVIHDAGNMFISHADHGPASVEILGDRLRHVHVKDERRVTGNGDGRFSITTIEGEEWFEPALLNEGHTDHEALFEALAAVGYDGFVTDECHVEPNETRGPVEIAMSEHKTLTQLIDMAT